MTEKEPTGIKKIKQDIRFQKFLWQNDNKYKSKLLKIIGISVSCITFFYFLDLSVLEPLILIPSLIQKILKSSALILTVIISLITWLRLNLSFHNKYKDPIENLTEQELEIYQENFHITNLHSKIIFGALNKIKQKNNSDS